MVKNCQVNSENAVYSDHQALMITLRLRVQKKKQKLKRKINWHKFMNPNIRDEFNDKLKVILEKFVDLGYKEFGKYIKMAANEVAKEEVNKNSRWFEHSRDFLIPIIK